MKLTLEEKINLGIPKHASRVKPVLMLDKDEKVVKRFNSLAHASAELGIHRSTLSKRILKNIVIDGFTWVYENIDFEVPNNVVSVDVGNSKMLLTEKAMENFKRKPYYMISNKQGREK